MGRRHQAAKASQAGSLVEGHRSAVSPVVAEHLHLLPVVEVAVSNRQIRTQFSSKSLSFRRNLDY